MADLLESVKATITDYNLLPPAARRVLVAVSGGPDSLALADLLFRLAQERRLFLCLAHLDHMFRGEESAEDARFVQKWAEELGLPWIIEARDVPALRLPGESKQEAARRVRYAFLEQAAAEFGAQRIAIAHTLTDQAETVLMRLLQGGGSTGLKGISPLRDRYIRPLIRQRREEVIEYCHERGLNFRVDPSNERPVYTRNKIRLELVPFIKANFNPRVEEALARTAEILRGEDEYLSSLVSAWVSDKVQIGAGECHLAAPKLLGEPIALQRRILRHLHQKLAPEQPLRLEHVEELLKLLRQGAGNHDLDWPGVRIEQRYANLTLRVRQEEDELLPGCNRLGAEELTLPGTLFWPNGLKISAEVYHGGVENLQKLRRDSDCPEGQCAFFDLDRLEPPLVVRPRQPGDTFTPFGLAGSKKIKDFFIDEKVPLEHRARIPIVLDTEGILWIAGMRQAERGRITTNTRRILRLKLEELP